MGRLAKQPKKFYTISTLLFPTLEEAKKQIKKFYEGNGGYRKDSKIMEVTTVYDVEVEEQVVVHTKKKDSPKATKGKAK